MFRRNQAVNCDFIPFADGCLNRRTRLQSGENLPVRIRNGQLRDLGQRIFLTDDFLHHGVIGRPHLVQDQYAEADSQRRAGAQRHCPAYPLFPAEIPCGPQLGKAPSKEECTSISCPEPQQEGQRKGGLCQQTESQSQCARQHRKRQQPAVLSGRPAPPAAPTRNPMQLGRQRQ